MNSTTSGSVHVLS